MRLSGKVAIVTGAGSGIGRASAVLFAREGAKVLCADINEAGGQATVDAITASGGEAAFQRVDVAESNDLRALFDAAARRFGGFDILFNNAGVESQTDDFLRTTEATYDRVLDINVRGVIVATQLALPLLIERGGGVILNTASMAGLLGVPMDPIYAASKGAVVMFTRSLYPWARTHNVRVNCLCPGPVDTPLLTNSPSSMQALSTPAERMPPEHLAAAALEAVTNENWAGKAIMVRTIDEGFRPASFRGLLG